MRIRSNLFLTVGLLAAVCLTGCENGQSKKDEKPSISFMSIALSQDVLSRRGSQKIVSAYEEYTGIQVDWTWVMSDVYGETLSYVMRDKSNLPMIVTYGGELSGDVVKEARNGSFWDLRPFLEMEELFPNLSQANEKILNALTVDGEVIGIYRSREIGRYGLSYRKDWAEAVGITEEPQTAEDVYELLYRFTWNDPDGNGKDDTFGLEMTRYTGSFDIIQTWFGCGNQWVEEDGVLIPVHETEAYLEALNWLRRIYEDGLMRPDWPLVDSETSGNALKNGQVGAVVNVMGDGTRAWRYYEENGISSVAEEGENASICMVGPIEGATLATSGYNGFFAITKAGAKTEEDVSQTDGAQYGLNQAVCYIPRLSNATHPEKQSVMNQAQEAAYERNREAAVYNPASGYLPQSRVFEEKGTTLDAIIEDARTMYVCGQIDEAQWREEIERWNQEGGAALKEELNQLHQEK